MTPTFLRRPAPAAGAFHAGASNCSSLHPRSILWYWGPILLYMLVIYLGSSISSVPDLPKAFSDKLAHVAEYGGLGLLLARGLAGPRWLAVASHHVVAAVALAALYGLSDELHQLFVPGRDFDLADLLADTVGAGVGAGALWAWGIIRRNSQESGLAKQH